MKTRIISSFFIRLIINTITCYSIINVNASYKVFIIAIFYLLATIGIWMYDHEFFITFNYEVFSNPNNEEKLSNFFVISILSMYLTLITISFEAGHSFYAVFLIVVGIIDLLTIENI